MTGKYSIIFMFDGGKTIRWRLGPVLLRALLTLLVLVPLVAAGSLWLNWKLWQGRQAMLAENAALLRTVENNAQTAARLANLEQFLSKADPEGLGTLVASVPALSEAPAKEKPANVSPSGPDGSAAQATPSPSLPEGEQPADDGVAAGLPTPSPDGEVPPSRLTPAASDSSAAPSAGADAARQPDESAPATADRLETAPVTPDTSAVDNESGAGSDRVDKGLVRVESLVARRVGTRSLRISFDLYNTEQVPQLSGKATFELLLANGASYPLDAHGDTTYRINRLKKIVGNPTLPPDVTDTQNAAIKVSIYADDDLIYRVVTPLQQ